MLRLMCNRYSRDVKLDVLLRRFAAQTWGERGGLNTMWQLYEPCYNIAPGSLAPAVFLKDGERRINIKEFGLVPGWCYGKRISSRFTNARAETITQKVAFKDLLASKRCLIPSSGYFDWKKEDGRKQPYHFRLKGGGVFGFAAVWEKWRCSDAAAAETYSFAIVTTSPNELCAMVHDRMPVILDEEAEKRWLDPDEKEPTRLLPLLRPFPAELMECYAVDPRMGYARFNDARCVEPWNVKPSQLTLLPNSRNNLTG